MQDKAISELKIALFVTCLVDMMRPEIGFATIKLVKQIGASIIVPSQQSCCAQPAYNSGDKTNARKIADQYIPIFKDFDVVIVPSGSCAGMLKFHAPNLYDEGDPMRKFAESLSAKIMELSEFLTKYNKANLQDLGISGHAAYHDSCSSLREMQIDEAPRALLASQTKLQVHDLARRESCCGFGGLFCVKYPQISNQMVKDKVADILSHAPDYLLAGDLGCLMNIAGKLAKLGHDKPKCYHYAEILAFGTNHPPIN